MYPNDILRLIFSFSSWRKYYDLCKLYDLDLQLNIVFNDERQRPDVIQLAHKYPLKYYEVIGYLLKIEDKTRCDWHIMLYNGVDLLRYLQSINYQFTDDFFYGLCNNTHIFYDCVKFLLSIGIGDPMKVLEQTIRFCKYEFIMYLYDTYNLEYSKKLMEIVCERGRNDIIIYFNSINHKKMMHIYQNGMIDMLIPACRSGMIETVKLVHSLGAPVTKKVIEEMERTIYYKFGSVSEEEKEIMQFLESVQLVDSDDENFDIF